VEPFKSWTALLAYLDAHSNIVHYRAPLDRHAVPVVVTRRFKNGKLRVAYHRASFTADQGHLARFVHKVDWDAWVLFTKRTEDPKLGWLERRLQETGVESRRNGETRDAPILEVRRRDLDAAWAILTPAVDAMADDHPSFSK
jgi:hypothetical protein